MAHYPVTQASHENRIRSVMDMEQGRLIQESAANIPPRRGGETQAPARYKHFGPSGAGEVHCCPHEQDCYNAGSRTAPRRSYKHFGPSGAGEVHCCPTSKIVTTQALTRRPAVATNILAPLGPGRFTVAPRARLLQRRLSHGAPPWSEAISTGAQPTNNLHQSRDPGSMAE